MAFLGSHCPSSSRGWSSVSDGGAVPSTILMSARLVPDPLPVSLCVLQIASGVQKNKKCTFMCQISKYGHHFSFWLTSSNCKQSLSLLSAVHSYRETTGDQCKHSERFLNVLAEKLTLYSQSTALSSRYRHHKSENTDNSVSISDSVTIPL